jgi:hypothetical protein
VCALGRSIVFYGRECNCLYGYVVPGLFNPFLNLLNIMQRSSPVFFEKKSHCLGHLSPDVLSKLSNSLAITCLHGRDDSLCHACQLGRHIRLPFPIPSSRVVCPIDLVHCDLWISLVLSLSGYKYYLVILDDCTHYSWTIFYLSIYFYHT